MSQPRLQNGSHALEANAASAGLALGCAYSSSAEYEAELIQVRRNAGAYGSPHHRQAFILFAVMAAAFGAALPPGWRLTDPLRSATDCSMSSELQGKAVLVTGVSRGIALARMSKYD